MIGLCVHYFIQHSPAFLQEQEKTTITPQSPRKYCYYDVFKIINGDPQLLFYILKVKYLKIMYRKY